LRKLEDLALLAGRQTPKQSDGKSPGKSRDVHLNHQAELAGWNSQRANDAEKRGMVSEDPRNGLVNQANMSGWPTACARDWRQSGRSKQGLRPATDNVLFGQMQYGGLALMGTFVESLHERINFRGALEPFIRPKKVYSKSRMLNPRFSLWLMGFPEGWASCGERVTRSSRRKRRNS
jgi:hypothetical protein